VKNAARTEPAFAELWRAGLPWLSCGKAGAPCSGNDLEACRSKFYLIVVIVLAAVASASTTAKLNRSGPGAFRMITLRRTK